MPTFESYIAQHWPVGVSDRTASNEWDNLKLTAPFVGRLQRNLIKAVHIIDIQSALRRARA